jgi:hypothetical protein
MMNDLTLAQAACVDIYDDTATWDDHWEFDGEIVVARRWINGDNIIVFRGSRTPRDWFDDLEALPVEVDGLGHVHRGFYEGLEEVLDKVRPLVSSQTYITGHSLGAARAYLFTQMLAIEGKCPRGVVAFAPPRPGFEDFRGNLVISGALVRGYHNARDPVPDVPLFPFCQPVPPIAIDVPPAPNDDDPLFECHHGPLYYSGVGQYLAAAKVAA